MRMTVATRLRYVFPIVALLIGAYTSFAQDPQDPVYDVENYLYNEIYKNIAAYQIRNSAFSFNDIPFDSLSYTNADLFYRSFLADYGYKLKLTISPVNLPYPVGGYEIYEIKKGLFEYVNNLGLPGIVCMGPISGDTYLVALNARNGEIKFISGQLFKTRIAADFKVNPKQPETMTRYIEFRTYDIGGAEIVFRRKRHKEFIFKGWSKKFNQAVTIFVNRKDTDIVSVKR